MFEVKVTVYKWAGSWGPFKIKIPCGECTLTRDIIEDTLKKELCDIPVNVEVKEWLTHWWLPVFKGGFHAPVVMVDGKVISQGGALNRGVLTEKVVESSVKKSLPKGNIIYGKDGCPHCKKAKEFLDKQAVSYIYLDVVKQPRALYEMIPRVKKMIGEKTPVTVPQIWIDGRYVGGADELVKTKELT